MGYAKKFYKASLDGYAGAKPQYEFRTQIFKTYDGASSKLFYHILADPLKIIGRDFAHDIIILDDQFKVVVDVLDVLSRIC